MTKSFTNQSKKDILEGMTNEEHTRMYAAFGKWIELSGSLIDWSRFIDYSLPEDVVIKVEEDGTMILETTIKLRSFMESEAS